MPPLLVVVVEEVSFLALVVFRKSDLLIARGHPAVLFFDLFKTEGSPQLEFLLIELTHALVEVSTQMHSLGLGLQEVLADLAQNLNEGLLSELDLILIIHYAGSNESTLINVDSHDVSEVVIGLWLDPDVLLIPGQ